MKYIVVQAPAGEAAVLFPREFMHRWVAGLFQPLPVVAAGFVRRSEDGLVCYGQSVGLKLLCRPDQDTRLVAMALADGGGDQPPG